MSTGKPRLRLRYTPLSPFARKVRVAAFEVGLSDCVELSPCDVWAPDSDIVADNPLGKVPALITERGTFIGSFLCCEYLDSLHETTPLIPSEPDSRWRVLQRHALADGIMEAAVARVTEALRRPPQFVYPGFLQRQWDKMRRALDAFEAQWENWDDALDIASITLGCALGYLDFRLPDLDWRRSHPRIECWNRTFAARPSMVATRPPAMPSVEPP